jgi:hypothetical protein
MRVCCDLPRALLLLLLLQEKLFAMTDKLGITPKLKSEDKELTGKALMKRIMQAWLPAHEVRACALACTPLW